MNIYLERLRELDRSQGKEKTKNGHHSELSKPSKPGFDGFEGDHGCRVFENSSIEEAYGRIITALDIRCPDLVPTERWHAAVADGQRFLAEWGDQARAFNWTPRDLFGLHQPPAKPHPSYSRLSRYDEVGLVWLLQGRKVAALTEDAAAIRNPTGSVTIYRRQTSAQRRTQEHQ
jgi:hypothetical protein